jgi:endonuclease YncB( thermonuclease family)
MADAAVILATSRAAAGLSCGHCLSNPVVGLVPNRRGAIVGAPSFMRAPLSLSFAVVASSIALIGCGGDPPLTLPPLDSGVADVGSGRDAPAPFDSGPPPLDSGCPASRTVTVTDVPRGFLAPSNVRFVREIDGDTSRFSFAIMGETTVRFLWINTEESVSTTPSENTAFGRETSAIVGRYLAAGTAFVVVRQASPRDPAMPALDLYMRTLGLVFVDGELFQQRLVREGLSAYYTDFGCAPEPIHTALLLSEAEARANHRGIWAPGHPTNYAEVFSRWINGGTRACRPNPFRNQSYCP